MKLKKLGIALGIVFLVMVLTIVIYVGFKIHPNEKFKPYFYILGSLTFTFNFVVDVLVLLEESAVTGSVLILLYKKKSRIRKQIAESSSSVEKNRESISPPDTPLQDMSRQVSESFENNITV